MTSREKIIIDSLKKELEKRVSQLNHIQKKLDKIVTEFDLEKQQMKNMEIFQSNEIKKLLSEQKMLNSINENLQNENSILKNRIEHQYEQSFNFEAQKQLYQKDIVLLQNQINQLNSQLDTEKAKMIKYIQDYEQQHKEIFNTIFLEKNIPYQEKQEYQTIFKEWEIIFNEENLLLAKINSLSSSEDLIQLNNYLEEIIMNFERLIQLINQQISVTKDNKPKNLQENTLKVLLIALNYLKNLKELLKSQNQQLCQIFAKINDHQTQLKTKMQNFKQMNQQIHREAEIEINQLKSKLQQENIYEKSQLRKQINDLIIECQQKIQENSQEKLKHQKIQTQAQKLQIDLNFCQEEKTKLQAQLQKWQSELNISQEENFKLKDLQIQLETKIKENSQLQSQNENIQSQLHELQHKLNLNLEQKDQYKARFLRQYQQYLRLKKIHEMAQEIYSIPALEKNFLNETPKIKQEYHQIILGWQQICHQEKTLRITILQDKKHDFQKFNNEIEEVDCILENLISKLNQQRINKHGEELEFIKNVLSFCQLAKNNFQKMKSFMIEIYNQTQQCQLDQVSLYNIDNIKELLKNIFKHFLMRFLKFLIKNDSDFYDMFQQVFQLEEYPADLFQYDKLETLHLMEIISNWDGVDPICFFQSSIDTFFKKNEMYIREIPNYNEQVQLVQAFQNINQSFVHFMIQEVQIIVDELKQQEQN